MLRNESLRKAIFLFCIALCLTPWVTPPVALFLGLIIAQFVGHPYQQHNKKLTTYLLQYSIIGLGFGMNIQTALKAGSQGILFTVVSILGTLLLGTLLGRAFKIDKKTSHLISSGTAICGGSAIAAVAPVIQAEEQQISVALGIVFILNSIALFVFPILGHQLHLTQHQFGLWSAIAIHDTSSGVGAASAYGTEALEVATTVKLARALWIIPVALGTAFAFRNGKQKIKIPYFIGGFVLAMVIYTYVPAIHPISPYIVAVAKKGLTITLFLIGAGLSRKAIRAVGVKPLLQGVILWVVISVAALWAVTTLAA
jgi:uncharacterized integral membrane protein (TIGR00698 family)